MSSRDLIAYYIIICIFIAGLTAYLCYTADCSCPCWLVLPYGLFTILQVVFILAGTTILITKDD
jgi:hypothetical protein